MITERLLRSWIRCRRKAWLDKHGEQKKRVWSPHRTLQLDHQHRSFVSLINESASKGRGIEACQKGNSLILGIRLKGKTPEGQSIEAHQPLLKKVEGISKWGNFSYIPVITRQGNKLSREHKLSLSFTAFLLEKIQETPVNKGLAISNRKNKIEFESFNLSKNLNNELLSNLIKLDKDLSLSKSPPITPNRRKCSICDWKGVCDSEANSLGHLSEISGVGAKRIELLKNLGIDNLEDLSISNPIKLKEDLGHPHGEIAHQIVEQALVQFNKNKKRLNPNHALPELLFAKGVILYDIESDPDAHHDFLHGLIIIKRNHNGIWDIKRANYQPMLTLSYNQAEDSLIWKRIKRKLNYYKGWPIIHYGETEYLSLYRLAKRNHATDPELKELKDRFIDIHSRIKRNWLLPINNYGLKSVANLIGFKWSQEGVDGPQALLWWRQWKNSRKKNKIFSKNLQNIFNYNKDDCLATWAITDWLLRQK